MVRTLRQSLALLVRGQGVVLVEVAERRLGAAELVRRDRWAVTARVDADLDGVHSQPGVVLPRLGP